MPARLAYEPWKITVQKRYRAAEPDKDHAGDIGPDHDGRGSRIVSEIFTVLKRLKRFPLAFGEANDAETIYLLIEGIKTPFSVLDPKFTTVSKAQPIKASELPKPLRELHARLKRLGHTAPD